MKKKVIAIIIASSLFSEIGTTTYAVDTTYSTTGYSYSEQSTSTNTTRKEILRKKGLIRYLIDGGYANFSDGFKGFFQQAYGVGVGKDNGTDYNKGNVTDNNLNLDIGSSIKDDGNNRNTTDNTQNNSTTPPQVTVTDGNGESPQVTTQTPTQEPTTQTPLQEPTTQAPSQEQTTQTPSQEQKTQTPATQQPKSVETPSVTPKTTQPQVPVTPSSTSDKFMAQVEKAVFAKVNQERAKAGRVNLSYNSTMEKYARIKSQDMGDRGYFRHDDPEGNLMTVRMQKDGVTYSAWGENIAYIGGVSDANALANQFMASWMNSPGHRANILSGNFTGIGLGVYKSGNKVYATQEFIR